MNQEKVTWICYSRSNDTLRRFSVYSAAKKQFLLHFEKYYTEVIKSIFPSRSNNSILFSVSILYLFILRDYPNHARCRGTQRTDHYEPFTYSTTRPRCLAMASRNSSSVMMPSALKLAVIVLPCVLSSPINVNAPCSSNWNVISMGALAGRLPSS